jgi:hypothetical protein
MRGHAAKLARASSSSRSAEANSHASGGVVRAVSSHSRYWRTLRISTLAGLPVRLRQASASELELARRGAAHARQGRIGLSEHVGKLVRWTSALEP